MFDLNKVTLNSATGEYDFSRFRDSFDKQTFEGWLHFSITAANDAFNDICGDMYLSQKEAKQLKRDFRIEKLLAIQEEYQLFKQEKERRIKESQTFRAKLLNLIKKISDRLRRK